LIVLVSDGVKEIPLLVESSLDDFRKFLKEFTDIKIIPAPNAKRVATELVIYDSINTNVKVYPFKREDCHDYVLEVDIRRGELSLKDGNNTTIDIFRIKTEAVLTDSYLGDGYDDNEEAWDDFDYFEEFDVEDWVDGGIVPVPGYSGTAEAVEIKKVMLEVNELLDEAERISKMVRERGEVKKLVVIEDEGSGDGVVLEVVCDLTTIEDLAETVEELLDVGGNDAYVFARNLLKEFLDEGFEEVSLSEYSFLDVYYGEVSIPYVHVYVGSKTVTIP